MYLLCPVCRAENTAGPACRRCRADLTLLASVEARRDFHFNCARTALHDRQFDVALTELARTQSLRDGADVRRLRACTFLLAGDFSAAFGEHSVGVS
jgi:hypothetical protein